MKRLFTLLMTLVLVFSVSDVAMAGQAKITVSGKQSVERGDEVTYTVSLADCGKANTLGIEIAYDNKMLTKVINDTDWAIEGKIQDFDHVKNRGVWAVDTAKKLNGDIFKLAFKVNGNAAIAETEVKVTVTVKNDANIILKKYTDTIKVNVVCEHVYGEWSKLDDNNHVHTCKNCQEKATEAHKWQNGVCTVCNAKEPAKKPEDTNKPGTGETTKPEDSKPESKPETKPESGTTTKPESTKPGNTKPSGTTTPNTEESAPAVEMKETVVKEKVEEIQKAAEGKDVVVEMKQADGKVATVVPVEILEAVKGKDVNVVLDMGEYSWIINGKDVAEEGLKDINLQVALDAKNVDEKVVKEIAGEDEVRQISLTHDGEFNFKAKLKLNMGKENAGKFGNLYYHNNGKLEFMNAAKVDAEGNVELEFEHASDYVVVVGRDRTAEEQNQDTTGDVDVPSTEEGTDTKPSNGGNAGTIVIVILVIAAIAGGAYYFLKKKN